MNNMIHGAYITSDVTDGWAGARGVTLAS